MDLTKGMAALAPLGGLGEATAGYKGYGFATVVEVLSAALQDGSYLKALNGFDADGNKIPYPLGHFFLAIDIEHFVPTAIFKAIAGAIMRDLRNSEKAPGETRIWTAGEKEHYIRQFRMEKGCPVPEALQKVMTEYRDRFELDFTYPWD